MNLTELEQLENIVIGATERYARLKYERAVKFNPGEDRINYSTEIFNQHEIVNLVRCALSGHLASGNWTQEYEQKIRKRFGARDAILVNSGSSANLLMMETLCCSNLPEHLEAGDYVLTTALGFPTTLAPIIQCGLKPAFIDIDLDTYNPRLETIYEVLESMPPVKAIFLAHPMGLPFDCLRVRDLCRERSIWLLEDNCDALGATADNKPTGTFGVMSSLSHFPAHHTTCGEGGTVIVNSPKVAVAARSIGNWGKACWCPPGKNNTCGKQFEWDADGIPWNHKYLFDNIGYNLKATDMQAAVLCAQVDKIDFIVEQRRRNFWRLWGLCRDTKLNEYFILPNVHIQANPSPYAFPLICRDGINRTKIVAYLENAKIETRPIFGGNLLRQPAFKNIQGISYNGLKNTDKIMRDGFFVGVHPFLGNDEMEYIAEQLREAIKHSCER